jgi:membrane protein implicated in regulation of membrane protease activity
MTWANFYLICFVVGFAFSVISFLSGGTSWHFHVPHWHGAYLHFGGHAPMGGHAPTIGHGPMAGGHGVGAHAPVGGGQATNIAGAQGSLYTAAGTPISPFNFVTLAAFLAWFGGTGYLLTRFSSVWFLLGLGIALIGGLVGGGIVFLFIRKVLTSEEENMDPADYDMIGVLGRTSMPIREGGTGEIIYSQAGTRRTCGARAENGTAIPKGTEVVVTRYERGIAYVRLWAEIAGEEETAAQRAE